MLRSRNTLKISQNALVNTWSVSTRKVSQHNPIKRTDPTVFELFKMFPAGLKNLYSDVQKFYNITDASKTKLNAWTKRGGANFIPRRQAEQQRQLIRDLFKVAVPVSFGCLPIIGNSVFLFLAWRPHWFLSSHFVKNCHHRGFVHDEYGDRLGAFEDCAKDFWHSVMTNHHGVKLDITGRDEAGATFDPLALYRLFEGQFNIPRQQLMHIAKASGMTSPVLWALPSAYIRFRLGSIAKDIIIDDSNLIQEQTNHTNCENLTDEEVLDACSFRGLPCGLDQSYDSMRRCLSNYLAMMETVHNEIGTKGLVGHINGTMFVLHLQAIRLKLDKINNSTV